jgi:glycosyltransferase involved in cell wall biosynthesis
MISSPGPVPAGLAPFTTKVSWTQEGAASAPATWDVGLMPLTDGLYERAKCGYKLLQYAAAGLPAVGSPVGVNRSLLTGMQGEAATTPGEWIDAIEAVLAESAEDRAVRAVAGRTVARQYSYATWEPQWRDAVGLPQASTSA